MKILLISTNRNILPMPVMPIGACIVAPASERAGHTVQLLDLMFTRDAMFDIKSALTHWQPDLVGLSVRNIDNNDMRDSVFFLNDLQSIVNLIRSRTSAPIILGGAALGVMPEQILRLASVTCAVIGDGEMAFPLLLSQISRNKNLNDLPGVAFIENGIFHRNSSASAEFSTICPMPDYNRWLNIPAYRSLMATVPVQTK